MGVKVKTAIRTGDEVNIEFEDTKTGEIKSMKPDAVLVALGRRPYSSGLNADKIKLAFDKKKRIVINSKYRTNHPHIQCIGDVTFGPMLAHKAEEEAIAAAEYIKYGHGHINYKNIPSILYCHPEVAWTGKTEEELKVAGIKYKSGKFPFKANSRAITSMDTDGFVKFIADTKTKKNLGVHIIGTNAGEMIAEAALAIEHGFKCEDIYRVCHAHSEAFKDVSMSVFGKSVNI